eukprot:1135778-Prymnesium_polylepis.1
MLHIAHSPLTPSPSDSWRVSLSVTTSFTSRRTPRRFLGADDAMLAYCEKWGENTPTTGGVGGTPGRTPSSCFATLDTRLCDPPQLITDLRAAAHRGRARS